jgi:hypothetical protein
MDRAVLPMPSMPTVLVGEDGAKAEADASIREKTAPENFMLGSSLSKKVVVQVIFWV